MLCCTYTITIFKREKYLSGQSSNFFLLHNLVERIARGRLKKDIRRFTLYVKMFKRMNLPFENVK